MQEETMQEETMQEEIIQEKNIIVIPVRLQSSRLPNKPLADIAGKPMFLHTAQRAKEAKCGQVLLAICDQEIAEIAQKHNIEYVMTDPHLPSGTDRVYHALKQYGKYYDYVINLQGDLPFIAPEIIRSCLAKLKEEKEADIATPVAEISHEIAQNENIVKVAISKTQKALYFSRAPIPHGGKYYYHIGVYAYRHAALEKFVHLPISTLEKTEKLEQLRALEENMNIYLQEVNTIPMSVDTPEDLAKVREYVKIIV